MHFVLKVILVVTVAVTTAKNTSYLDDRFLLPRTEEVHLGDWITAAIIKSTIDGIIEKIAKKGFVTIIDSWNYTIPDEMKNIGEGNIALDDTGISFDLTKQNVTVSDNANGGYDIRVSIYIKKATLKVGYDVDMAFFNLIPLYGAGETDVAVRALRLDVSLWMAWKLLPVGLNSFVINDLSVKSDQSAIYGLYRNPDGCKIISNIMNVVEEAVILFYDLEQKCITCILEQAIEFVLKNIFKQKTTFSIDCPCLKINTFEYDLKSKLENLVTSCLEAPLENTIELVFSEELSPMWNDVYKRTMKLLDRKGILKQLM